MVTGNELARGGAEVTVDAVELDGQEGRGRKRRKGRTGGEKRRKRGTGQ